MIEELNIFKNPKTGDKIEIKSTLLIYRLRDILKNKPDVKIGSAKDMAEMLLFGVGSKSLLMQDAVNEYHLLSKQYEGYKIGELI